MARAKTVYRARIDMQDMKSSNGIDFKARFVVAIFDMLRYDGARITEVTPSRIDIESEHPLTMGRWRSFGIVPQDMGHSTY